MAHKLRYQIRWYTLWEHHGMLETDCNSQTLGLSYFRFYLRRWTKRIHSYMFWHPVITHIGNMRFFIRNEYLPDFFWRIYTSDFLMSTLFLASSANSLQKLYFSYPNSSRTGILIDCVKKNFFYIGSAILRPPSLMVSIGRERNVKSEQMLIWS